MMIRSSLTLLLAISFAVGANAAQPALFEHVTDKKCPMPQHTKSAIFRTTATTFEQSCRKCDGHVTARWKSVPKSIKVGDMYYYMRCDTNHNICATCIEDKPDAQGGDGAGKDTERRRRLADAKAEQLRK